MVELVERLNKLHGPLWIGGHEDDARTVTEAAARIAALEAENARLNGCIGRNQERWNGILARFDAPGGNLFSYVAELEAKLTLLERQTDEA